MSLQSQDTSEVWAATCLAYLRFFVEEEGIGVRAALFVVNGHGEPLEFCFTRVNSPSGPLWGADPFFRRAVADLARALLTAVQHRPDLVLVLDEEAPPDFSAEGLAVRSPVGLVARAGDRPVRWLGPVPDAESPLAGLLELLASRRRLLEPFERAAQGLEEAYAHQ